MYAFHGFDNMFIAHTQVPQSHDLLFRFCHVAPQGSAVLAKGTTNRGTVEEINPVTQIDEGRVYLMEWIMDWNDTPSSNKTTQLSVKHIWTMTLTAGLQRLGETWKKKTAPGCWIWQQDGWKRERWHLFCIPSIIPGILNVESSGTSDSSDICRNIIYNLYSIQHMLLVITG